MRTPDFFDAPDPDRCKACGCPIDDTTNCKQTLYGDWLCEDCTTVADEDAAFDADDPRSKPMSMFGAGLFEAFTGRKGN